jgi:TRAP transporter TAXI family solute receptor
MTLKERKQAVVASAVALVAGISLLGIFQEANAAEPYTITTGGKSGTYIKVGHNLAGIIPGGTVVTSKGSVENLDRIMAGEAQLGIVQLDALAWYADKKPESVNKIELMGSLYEECVYIAYNKKGKVQNEDDLQREGVTIAVGKKGSGGAVTWDYMRKLEPGYAKASVSYTGGTRALNKLAVGESSGIDAVLWVTKPVLSGKHAQSVVNNDAIDFLDVNDMDLNDVYKPIGKPIYEFRTIESEKGFFNDQEFKTICVNAALVADTDADEDLLEEVADVTLNYTTSLVPQTK